jgi:hypothetical protein
MRYNSIFFGGIVLVFGLALLGGNLLSINIWPFLIPVLIIFIGVWLLVMSRVGPQKMELETASIPLDGATRAEIRIRHGAGRLTVAGGAGAQDVASGSFGGGLSRQVNRRGDTLDVEMKIPEDLWFRGGGVWFVGAWSPIVWDVRLNENIPLTLDFETGAGENKIDLSALKAVDIRLKTGASSSELTLPVNAGRTKVKISSGAAAVVVRVPDGVAANIRVQSGLAGINIDERRFPRSGNGYTSPDYAQAANAVDIDVETGVGSIEIR